jgi:MOSC domain-containing protein YiiM
MAKVVSVNVGLPRKVEWMGTRVTTSIFKEPVAGPVRLRLDNLDGDRQSDLSVHGGPDKAVYAYPAEHYAFWRDELPGVSLSWGHFGENLTVEGLREDAVSIGDRFRIGTAEVRVTTPRLPCFKLGLRFGRNDVIRRFLASERTGFYLAVVREGEVEAGSDVELLEPRPGSMTVSQVARLYGRDKDDVGLLERAAALEALPESWREAFRERLGKHRA